MVVLLLLQLLCQARAPVETLQRLLRRARLVPGACASFRGRRRFILQQMCSKKGVRAKWVVIAGWAAAGVGLPGSRVSQLVEGKQIKRQANGGGAGSAAVERWRRGMLSQNQGSLHGRDMFN